MSAEPLPNEAQGPQEPEEDDPEQQFSEARGQFFGNVGRGLALLAGFLLVAYLLARRFLG